MSIQGWVRFLVVGALLTAAPAARAQLTQMPASLDDEFAQLSASIPGFGGLYLDAQGTTHVYLLDLSHAGDVQDLGVRVEVEQGDYDFRDLYTWKQTLRPLLAQGGAVSLDIDEQRNRLRFDVRQADLETFTATLASFLPRVRVPANAVLVEAAAPTIATALLTDRVRPVPAGVQLAMSFGNCTLGANAHRGAAGFVTASHCTRSDKMQGGLDNTVFFQTSVVTADRVGVETFDPPLFTGGACPSGRQCRLSDAAFVSYDSASLSAGGQIANPLSCGISGPQPLTVNPVVPRLSVTAVSLMNSLGGSVVTKVGRTSGCTFGAIQNTCEDVNVYKTVQLFGIPFTVDTGVTLLCQNRVGAYDAPGDSGSPVFMRHGNEATMAGILWGGDGSSFVYSPWLWVFSELGVLPDTQ